MLLKIRLLIVLGSMLLCVDAVKAEMVHLKDGTKIKGSILKMDETQITIRSADLGEVTFPRHRVEKITEGDASEVSEAGTKKEDPKIEININNDNSNKVEQKNKQVVENNVEVNTESKEEPAAFWGSGILGRFALGSSSVKIAKDGGGETQNYSGLGLYWDLVGYRSADFWEVTLSSGGGGETKDGLSHSWNVTGITGTINFFRRVFQNKERSKFFVSLTVGGASYSIENESINSKIEYSGSGSMISFGYDYLMSSHWGLTAGLTALSGTLKTGKAEVLGRELESHQLENKLKLSGSTIWVGVAYNYDFDD